MSTRTGTRPYREVPGPRQRWLSGNISDFRSQRLGFLDHCFRSYGDTVAIRLGPYPILLVNHPDLIEDVLVTQNRRFIKHFALRKRTSSTLGNGLLTSEHEFWRRQRRLSQPAFHRDRIAGYAQSMAEAGARMVSGWRSGQCLDFHEAMMKVTLEIVAKTLFDADVATEAATVHQAMETVLDRFTSSLGRLVPVPEWLPTRSNRQLRSAIRSLDSILGRVVEERRREAQDRGDLLSMLLSSTDQEGDGGGMSDVQLRDELMTLFLAGHETTANTLVWVFYLLSQNPEAERKLQDELDTVLNGRAPSLEDLARLPYTTHVVAEALRVLPTVWLLGREATEPTVVGDVAIPKGTTVYMSQWVVHRDERWFDEPTRFIPERWEGDLTRRIHRYAYFPFGGGPRVCIGNHFALVEAAILTATIAQNYRVRPVLDQPVELVPTMTLRPRGGLPARLEGRR